MAGLASLPVAAVVLPALPAQAGSWRQSEWWLSKLHVTQAWRSGEGAGVTVAVLADGVDASQPDLSGSVLSGPDFTRSGRAPGNSLYGVIGTGIASLIAGHGHGRQSASGEHAAGIHGVADRARILSVRVTLSPGDPLWSDRKVTARLPGAIAAGVRYAVLHNASVIALPADPGLPGVHGWGNAAAAAGGSAAERAAVAFAVRHNVVLVAPAGDNAQAGDAPEYPAAYRGVIAVGAFGRKFITAPYSSQRGYVELTAAGAGVTAAAPAGYQTMNSTWAASAIVGGVAALVRSRCPNLSAAQVLTAMTRGTRFRPRNGAADGSGHGTLDAQLAVAQAASMSPPHARSASAGALPRRRPVMPHVESQASIIEMDLLQDGAISAAALALLLVPILWYGRVAKRREQAAAAALAERRSPAAISAAPRTAADPLLGYFGPQHAPAAVQQAARPRLQRPGLTGRSTLSPAFAARPVLPAPPEPAAGAWSAAAAFQAAPTLTGQAQAGAADTSVARSPAPAAGQEQSASGEADSPARPGQAEPGFRPVGHSTVRHAPVSGSPPWEPAPRPTSELPWAVASGPLPGAARAIARPAGPSVTGRLGPPESVWQPAQEVDMPASAPLPEPPPPEGAPEDAWPDRHGYDPQGYEQGAGHWASDTGTQPIYVWNPAAQPGEDERPGR